MCEHDDTHKCLCSYAGPHTFTLSDEKACHLKKAVLVPSLIQTQILETRGCVIISSPSWSCNHYARRSFKPRGFFLPKCSLLLVFVVVHTFTVKHLHFQPAFHFLLTHRTLNNARLCWRIPYMWPTYKEAQHCQLWFTEAQLHGQENLNTPVYSCVYTWSFTQVVTHIGAKIEFSREVGRWNT